MPAASSSTTVSRRGRPVGQGSAEHRRERVGVGARGCTGRLGQGRQPLARVVRRAVERRGEHRPPCRHRGHTATPGRAGRAGQDRSSPGRFVRRCRQDRGFAPGASPGRSSPDGGRVITVEGTSDRPVTGGGGARERDRQGPAVARRRAVRRAARPHRPRAHRRPRHRPRVRASSWTSSASTSPAGSSTAAAPSGRNDLEDLRAAAGSFVAVFYSRSGYTKTAVLWAEEHHIALFGYTDTGYASPANPCAVELLHRAQAESEQHVRVATEQVSRRATRPGRRPSVASARRWPRSCAPRTTPAGRPSVVGSGGSAPRRVLGRTVVLLLQIQVVPGALAATIDRLAHSTIVVGRHGLRRPAVDGRPTARGGARALDVRRRRRRARGAHPAGRPRHRELPDVASRRSSVASTRSTRRTASAPWGTSRPSTWRRSCGWPSAAGAPSSASCTKALPAPRLEDVPAPRRPRHLVPSRSV